MGVPKFFRYTSERYPCLNELVKQCQIPDFDNMYLDMNGIIHNCSHPDDSNAHFRITEEKIFQDIFHYLSILFQIIKPKKLFFMAIDGVAPRAKMNQQRGRRFRSAREAEQLEEKAKAKGETLPKEKRFDSNCITPGTVFMARLHEQLKYFIKHKITTDPLWAKVRVILSGHETPGEGEHKIMDYIRWARSQPDYNPDTRHCLYGLDADLIMLGMCTHEPHFALLREEVKFGHTTEKATSPEETNFYLLHLSLMREYLEQEFIGVKNNLPFEYDLEKIVDDWVLMGFLVGNDFIPNLPNMHISNDALPLLYKTYMAVLPQLDGYINEAGDLHMGRFETFMQELAKIDKEAFQDTYADLKYFEAKTGRRPNDQERKEYKPNNDETFNVNIEDIKANEPDDELRALIEATADMLLDGIEDDGEFDADLSDEEANFNMEFALHKKDYYMNKLDYSKVTEEVLASQAECYVRAIQWNLHYYYRGCASWCWFYPHHYAPFISDIKGFKDLKIDFELGEPFKPFEQLLAVLPAASKNLLPDPFHKLMTDEESPIVHYYPINFETDLNGKKNDWEAVVLIPFIDENNLLSAMEPCYLRLTEEERHRNLHGPMLLYNWVPDSQGEAKAPEYFPAIAESHANETLVWRAELEVPEKKLKRGMLPAAKRDMFFPGFPTMRHLKYKAELKRNKVRVFNQPSRNDNMVVEILQEDKSEPPLEETARQLLGRVVWVGWPHLSRAKVISVSNEKTRYHCNPSSDNSDSPDFTMRTEQNVGNLHKQWLSERSTIVEHNTFRLGIELGDVKTIVHAVNLKGHKYLLQGTSSLTLEPVWCSVACGYALQAVVQQVSAYTIPTITRYATPHDAYPPGESVFLMTGPYYGSLAKVVSAEGVGRSGRVKVQVSESAEPVPTLQSASTPYRTAHHAAAACGITPQMLSRITGSVFVVLGEKSNLAFDAVPKVNLGLNLKFNKKNQEVSGYTRRCGTTNTWTYSNRCVELVLQYSRMFPDLIERMACSLGNDMFYEAELWPGEIGGGKPQEIADWLKRQPHASAVKRECGSEALEPEEMKRLAAGLDAQVNALRGQDKKIMLQVKISLLYKPDLHEGDLPPDPKADFKIYDRVVCAANNITVPLGAKGTITAVYRQTLTNTVRLSDKMNVEPTYQVMFDEPFPSAVKEDLFDTPRFYRMLGTNMLNISFGRKLRDLVSAASGYDNDIPVRNQTPNILRKEDGHHSAFASYSPTKDRHTPTADARDLNTPHTESQDHSTELLKSLLKISMPATTPPNKTGSPTASSGNWRARSDQGQKFNDQPAPRPPPTNWRSGENNNVFSNRAATGPVQDWSTQNTGRIYKNAQQKPPQIPPFPNLSQQRTLQSVPVPTQIPFPHFQNPHNPVYNQPPHVTQEYNKTVFVDFNNYDHLNQRNSHYVAPQVEMGAPNTGQGYQNVGNYNRIPQNVHRNGANFPVHLPSVGTPVQANPIWATVNTGQGANPRADPNNSVGVTSQQTQEKVVNPFVPLQVIAKQRRSQNTGGGPQLRKNSSTSSALESDQPKPPTEVYQPGSQVLAQNINDNAKPQRRKKKCRIAANLPFNLDQM